MWYNIHERENTKEVNEMKRRTFVEADHSKISWSIKHILKFCDIYGMELQFKLADRMAERNLTVRDLSALSGLRLATISDIMNGNRSSINFQHLTMLMVALRLSKVSDLIDIYIPEYICDYFEKDSAEWIATGETPSKVLELKQWHTMTEEQQQMYEDNVEEEYKKHSEKAKQLRTEFKSKNKGSN